MKPIKIFFVITILLFTYACNSTKIQKDTLMEITGTIEAIEMSSWQYGTHTISKDENFYALTSEKIDLKTYEGKTVRIKAEKIAGYPVDGGPEYLEVHEIRE
ncbi:hypothetical protein [Gillisia limnaea]|uniref:Secreted protein n=1 Tax=Gillisia limnaea (strain DSM 15749 / LMG 21470 / R-8282) TaxID=865937 RepID=H2BVH6_GILLR|nr:hypothetical protein [Gillisia limnaea]EHQ02884.1 secreted protein [Gillisia limnaea DSM 15749]